MIVLYGCAEAEGSAQHLALALAKRARMVVLLPQQDAPNGQPSTTSEVDGVLRQSLPTRELVPLLAAAIDGVDRTGPKADPAVLPALSRREHQVLSLVARGLTHQQIARRLQISIHTVDTYVRRIKEKWKLGNKADLTRAALPLLQREPLAS
ncbi:response regulator transcription factor [Micromonospora sp. RP3T]|uniref:helix-turn-helix transcriptional regulator n=1 Tax=Micromonospora sp. RP3T TaxID=2135446 RepID=UPI003D75EA8B